MTRLKGRSIVEGTSREGEHAWCNFKYTKKFNLNHQILFLVGGGGWTLFLWCSYFGTPSGWRHSVISSIQPSLSTALLLNHHCSTYMQDKADTTQSNMAGNFQVQLSYFPQLYITTVNESHLSNVVATKQFQIKTGPWTYPREPQDVWSISDY